MITLIICMVVSYFIGGLTFWGVDKMWARAIRISTTK